MEGPFASVSLERGVKKTAPGDLDGVPQGRPKCTLHPDIPEGRFRKRGGLNELAKIDASMTLPAGRPGSPDDHPDLPKNLPKPE